MVFQGVGTDNMVLLVSVDVMVVMAVIFDELVMLLMVMDLMVTHSWSQYLQHTQVALGEVVTVTPTEVVLHNGTKYTFDYLVIASGSHYSFPFGTEGNPKVRCWCGGVYGGYDTNDDVAMMAIMVMMALMRRR